MMPIRIIMSTAFLLCALHAARALGMESMFLDEASKLPVELSLVKNCGNWEADGQRGYIRMIVADVTNGVGNELYVQWIAVKDSKPGLIKTLAIAELNNDHSQYAFKAISCGEQGSAVSIKIEADYEHDEGDQTHEISIELGDIGKYRLVNEIRKR